MREEKEWRLQKRIDKLIIFQVSFLIRVEGREILFNFPMLNRKYKFVYIEIDGEEQSREKEECQ